MSNALARILDQHSPAGDAPSLWAQGDAAPVGPSGSLRVLDSHRPEVRPHRLDIWGERAIASLGRLRRPFGRLRRMASAVHTHSVRQAGLSDEAFQQAVHEAQGQCRMESRQTADGAVKRSDLRALSLVAEAVRRVHGFSPHRVQLIGALALLEGRMAEMATGEGKTLTAAMAAVVAAWRGLPCHVVTANDYLAARDAQIGQQLFSLCQVSVASVTGETSPGARGAAYSHDIVYTTAKELLADHLRDDLALGRGAYRTRFSLSAARQGGQASIDGVVMRGIHQVIVDEADSVLIDEAVTPLIISAKKPDELLERAALEAVQIARRLEEGKDFVIQKALRHIEWTPEGRSLLQSIIRDMPAFWRRADRAEELVQMALYAMHLMVRDQHYVVEDDKVILVDELTGRLADQRTLSLGMQQVLEASLDIPITDPAEVSARSSFQRFFKLFNKVGGMTGTAREAAGEFAKVYGLTLVRVPTHRRVRRKTLALHVSRSEQEKFLAIARECQRLIAIGRPVLIGVRSVRSSLALEQCVRAQLPGANIQVLHALEHERESSIVARAGQSGTVTIATNMAGRGTDISLEESVREKGGLHVIVGEINDFARIDRQLVGRCARQGDPGSVRFFISIDDELFRRFLPRLTLAFWGGLCRSRSFVSRMAASMMIARAQRAAESLAFRQRALILDQDTDIERDGF